MMLMLMLMLMMMMLMLMLMMMKRKKWLPYTTTFAPVLAMACFLFLPFSLSIPIFLLPIDASSDTILDRDSELLAPPCL
jgi:uncharacterized oligopeptide transporter (OPT) family protein